MPEPNLEIAVECIECGQDVCVHQQKVIRDLEAELREAREALRDSARHHHDTITPSRLHDPEHLSFDDCPAKTCVRARGVLEKGPVA